MIYRGVGVGLDLRVWDFNVFEGFRKVILSFDMVELCLVFFNKVSSLECNVYLLKFLIVG